MLSRLFRRSRTLPGSDSGVRLPIAWTAFPLVCAVLALLGGCTSEDSPTPPITEAPDTTAPGVVTDLRVGATAPFSITLLWTAPGDDDTTGTLDRYEIRYKQGTFQASDWPTATPASAPVPGPPGSEETAVIRSLQPQTDYGFALRSVDKSGNASALSNFVEGETPPDEDASWWEGLAEEAAPDDPIRALRAYRGQLYVGGEFTSVAGTPAGHVARFENGALVPVGTGFAGGSEAATAVHAFTEFRGVLVAGGAFTLADGIEARGVAWLDDEGWRPFGTGINGVVRALEVYQNELYAGGTFTSAGDVEAHHLARWDGARWLPVETSLSPVDQVLALRRYGGRLYVGGSFTEIGGVAVSHIAAYDGTTWDALGGGLTPGFLASVSALGLYGGELVVTGRFGFAGEAQANHIASWNDTRWTGIGPGFNILDFQLAQDVIEYKNELYVTGGMTLATGPEVSGIARWTGKEWTTVGSGLSDGTGLLGTLGQAFAVVQDSLYVGGDFREAGGRPSFYLGRWSGIPSRRE